MEAFNLKFVAEVEKRPELYNHNLPEYSRRDCTERAWKEISKQFDMSVTDCKEKWRNLRTTFVKNHKWLLTSVGKIKKKPYYLQEAMHFTIPFIKMARRERNPEIGRQTNSPPPTPDPNDVPSEETIPETRNSAMPSDAYRALVDYFQAKTAKLADQTCCDHEKREGIQNFVNSLIPDLMGMDDVQLRNYKRRSLLLVDEILGTPQEEMRHPADYPIDEEFHVDQKHKFHYSHVEPSSTES